MNLSLSGIRHSTLSVHGTGRAGDGTRGDTPQHVRASHQEQHPGSHPASNALSPLRQEASHSGIQ